METRQFKKFCDIAYQKAGIDLKEGKEALVSARVAKRLRALKMNSVSEYLGFLESDETESELVNFLDAISTNYTHFYREMDHFEELEKHITSWIKDGQSRFRIWSAASSSGEEPYSIVMTMLDAIEGRDIDFKLLATDISTRILSKAIEGKYSADRVEPVSRNQRSKYMIRHKAKDKSDDIYEIKPEVKQAVMFKRLNLSTPPFPMSGPLDFVFCRNVMIYFDRSVRQRLISDVERLLKPGGILVVGHTETLAGIKHGMRVIRPSVYEKSL